MVSMSTMLSLAALSLLVACSQAQTISATMPTGDTLTSSLLAEPMQRAMFNTSNYIFSFDTAMPAANNAGGEIVSMSPSSNGLLATIPGPGISLNRGTLNPCSILLPHIHPRATEIYYVINGNFSVGLVQENGQPPIAGNALTNEAFVVPQGLIHYMANLQCAPASFTQSFSNIDPGLLSLPVQLPGFNAEILSSSGLSATASSLGPFAIDQACAARCGTAPAPSTTTAGK